MCVYVCVCVMYLHVPGGQRALDVFTIALYSLETGSVTEHGTRLMGSKTQQSSFISHSGKLQAYGFAWFYMGLEDSNAHLPVCSTSSVNLLGHLPSPTHRNML